MSIWENTKFGWFTNLFGFSHIKPESDQPSGHIIPQNSLPIDL